MLAVRQIVWMFFPGFGRKQFLHHGEGFEKRGRSFLHWRDNLPHLRRSEVGLIKSDDKIWTKKKGRQQGRIYGSQWDILAAEGMKESSFLPVVPPYNISSLMYSAMLDLCVYCRFLTN